MKLSEQIGKDRERFRKLPDRQSKAHFLWDYYKVPLLVCCGTIVFLLVSLIGSHDRRDVCLHAVLINNDSLVISCDDTVFDRLLADYGYETKGKKAEINADFALGREGSENQEVESLQVLSAMFALDDIDIYVSDRYYFDYFREVDAFHDLSVLLPEELIRSHEEDLYRYENSQGQSIIGGIFLHEGSPLHEAGYYHNDIVLGIATNCGNLEAAQAVILQILSDRN